MSDVELKEEKKDADQTFDDPDDSSHEDLVDPRVQVCCLTLNLMNK